MVMDQLTQAAIQDLEDRAAKILDDAQAQARESLDDAKAQARELLRIAANLRGTSTEIEPAPEPRSYYSVAPPRAVQPSASSRITPNQFSGMTRSRALEAYMKARRHEGRIPLANIILDLQAGGLDMGEHRDRWERHIIVTAQSNPRLFCYDPARREVWLAPTADQPPPQKMAGRRKLQIPKLNPKDRRTKVS